MDMQNVSDLQIPEGTVRTIHDKDNRLIWGRVNYDTKYTGDTLQNGTPTPDAPIPVQTVTGEQTVEVHGKNLFSSAMEFGSLNGQGGIPGTATTNAIRTVDYIPVLPNTTYIVSNSNDYYNYIYQYDSNKNFIYYNAERPTYTFTTRTNTRFIKLRTNAGTVENDLSTKFQLELGSIATAYEPYQSQSYTVDLGSIELCKIGNYQDYIYKSGDDWYMHKETLKYVYSDSSQTAYFDSSIPRVSFNKPTNIVSSNLSYCNQFTFGDSETTNNKFNFGSTRVFMHSNEKMTSSSNWNSWMGQNPVVFYFPLTTPVNTQITDQTLIDQLDSVHQFLTRYGYNATVTGNLPLIVDRTNL